MVEDEDGKDRKAGQVTASYSGFNHIPLLSILIRSLIHYERSFLSPACRKLEKAGRKLLRLSLGPEIRIHHFSQGRDSVQSHQSNHEQRLHGRALCYKSMTMILAL